MSDRWLRYIRDPNPWEPPDPRPGPIETERLVVRLYQKGDGPRLYEAIDGNRASLLPWMVWSRTDHQDVVDSTFYAEKVRRSAESGERLDFAMGIFDRTGERLLGGTGLHRIRPHLREAEIGYWVRGDEAGKGVATESTGALISSALTPEARGGWGFRRIVIYNDVENHGSRRVCEKLGLRLEQRMRAERYLDEPENPAASGYRDMLGFAVLSDEWDFEKNRAHPAAARHLPGPGASS